MYKFTFCNPGVCSIFTATAYLIKCVYLQIICPLQNTWNLTYIEIVTNNIKTLIVNYIYLCKIEH